MSFDILCHLIFHVILVISVIIKIINGGWSLICSKVCVKTMVGEDMGCLRVVLVSFSLTCIMYLGYVSSEIVILVVIEITVTKVIMASILKVVIKDRCVFKKWVVPDSHRAVSRIELLRS